MIKNVKSLMFVASAVIHVLWGRPKTHEKARDERATRNSELFRAETLETVEKLKASLSVVSNTIRFPKLIAGILSRSGG